MGGGGAGGAFETKPKTTRVLAVEPVCVVGGEVSLFEAVYLAYYSGRDRKLRSDPPESRCRFYFYYW
jgi:hypothetical protein